LPNVGAIGNRAFQGAGNAAFVITLGQTAPLLSEAIFSRSGDLLLTVTVNIPDGASSYGTVGEYSSSSNSTTACWANGFRGAGWVAINDGFGFIQNSASAYINQNITVVLQTIQ
jgi:hypothetical protein